MSKDKVRDLYLERYMDHLADITCQGRPKQYRQRGRSNDSSNPRKKCEPE